MTNILIVGGTGSLGRELTKFYVSKGWNVTVYSRDPHKQIALKNEVPSARFILGDIQDLKFMYDACENQDVVINAAAIKHVHIGEEHPQEVIRVNVMGAIHVANVCHDIEIPKVLLISSDKAIDPINTYGRTKALSEDVYNQLGYSSLRYGNVIGSLGSVLLVWRDALKSGKKIILRDPSATRFFLTIREAVDLVDEAISHYVGGGVFVPNHLKAFRIETLALAMGIKDYELGELLGGEKRHEILLSPHEQGRFHSNNLSFVWKGYQGHLNHDNFSSVTAPRMTVEELRRRISVI